MLDLRTSECKYGARVRREWDKFVKEQRPLFDSIELPPVYWNGRLKRAHGRTMYKRLTDERTRIEMNKQFMHTSATMESFASTLRHEFIHLLVHGHGAAFKRIAKSASVGTHAMYELPLTRRRNR